MNKLALLLAMTFFLGIESIAQIIPMDTANLEITGNYIFETFQGKSAIYSQSGTIKLKNQTLLNGTIEFDLFLKDTQMFPGVYFRANGENAEEFYIRPHQSGNPDANQAIPLVNGLTAWQLYYGPSYSFPYNYKYDDWTHVKLVVNGDRAQVFLDYSESPHLSWILKGPKEEGALYFTGANNKGVHFADFSIDKTATELIDFAPIEREGIEGLIAEWTISEKFEEKSLDDPKDLKSLIEKAKWIDKIGLEEKTAVNISRLVTRYDDKTGNTVFAKLEITSDTDQIKLFEFGYSDRVVAILNGKPLYWGNNRFRSRDYRYLGTIGLFDAIYLDLKKGKNTLLMAVSEDFGGWLITGRFKDNNGLKIK